MKKTIYLAALAGALTFSAGAFAAPPGYDNNPGRLEAQSHTGKCDGYDGTATTTGAGAGGFGYQQGQGNNQAGGRQGEPNYNPLICGNPNDAALTRGQPN
jgi:hypothetical protein